MIYFLFKAYIYNANLCCTLSPLCAAEEKKNSCLLSSPSIALTDVWMCFWVRFQVTRKESVHLSRFGFCRERGVEGHVCVYVCACGEGVQGVSAVGGVKWVLANFSGRLLGSSWLVVKRGSSAPSCCQTAPRTTVPRMCECESVSVSVCVCVYIRCCSSILVRTTLSFGPWGVRTFLSSHASKFDSVMVEDRPTLKCVLLYFTGIFGQWR